MELNNAVALVNERIRNIKQYHLEPELSSVKLNQNENPYDWPDEIKCEIAEFARTRPWNRYPNFVPNGLKQKLAEYTGVPASGILVGNGSNEMILVLMLSLSGQEKDVVLCQPTFTVYQLLATGVGANITNVPLKNNLTFDVEAVCDAVQKRPGSLLVLCSPNNPTGASLSEADVKKILSVHTGVLVLDHAYIEFGGFNAVSLLKSNPNLIVLRTFSKAFAGAGFRLGYMLGTPEIIGQINKIKLPYNINFFSEQVAGVLVEKRALMQPRIQELVREREALLAFCTLQPFEVVYKSDANFFMVRCAKKNELFTFLKSKSILVRDVSSYPLCENCLRINVGNKEENKLLISAITAFFAL